MTVWSCTWRRYWKWGFELHPTTPCSTCPHIKTHGYCMC